MKLWQGKESAEGAELQVSRAELSKALAGASEVAALGGERLGRRAGEARKALINVRAESAQSTVGLHYDEECIQ